MRSQDEVQAILEEARQVLSTATGELSRGHLQTLDFTGIAGQVGIIQALEWVLGETEELHMQINPLRRSRDDL